ncbi:glycosyltransferase [Psychrobacter aestuarii]|uniref:Glycosyltransferase n=1 Tax=Psychrobacter aestuarii TaxID=556327 RepID=A0ABN0VY01_9GAMM|nr:glycosyltransferase [Psychrobacter aestuarii]
MPTATAKQPERIVLVINSLQGAGAERFVLTIGSAFDALGFDVHVVRFDPKVEFALPENLKYHLIDYQGYRWLPKGAIRYRMFARSIDNYILKHIGTPALVLSNLERADSTLRYSRLPNIIHVIHNTLSLYYHIADQPNPAKRTAELQNVYGTHPCVCVSEGVETDFIQSFGNITKVTTVHNPIDQVYIRQLAEAFVPEYKDYLIHVGSFKKAKRHDILIQAYAKTSQRVPLLLAGQGKLEQEIKTLITQLGLEDKVIMLGFCENVFPYLKHAKCKVLTSEREGFALVLAEALALDVPVISTDCQSGPREILGAHQLMPVNDIDAIAAKLEQAMQQPEQFAHPFNTKFLPHNIAKAYLRFANVAIPDVA